MTGTPVCRRIPALLVLLLLAPSARAGEPARLTVETVTEAKTANTTVLLSGGAGMGAVDLVVGFDPGRLAFRAARPGPAAGEAFLETGTPSSRSLRVGLVCPAGTVGDGELVRLEFDRSDDSSPPPTVRLESAEAWRVEDLSPVAVELPAPTGDGPARKLQWGVVLGLLGLGGVALLFFLFPRRR